MPIAPPTRSRRATHSRWPPRSRWPTLPASLLGAAPAWLLRALPASLLSAAALTLGLLLLGPTSAAAHSPAVGARGAVAERCARRPHGTSEHRPRSRACTDERTVKHPAARANGRTRRSSHAATTGGSHTAGGGPFYAPPEVSLGAPGTGAHSNPSTPGSSASGSSGEDRTIHETGPSEADGNLLGETDGVVSDPIDSRFLTDVPFGASSFWIQPWRAYLDTWPASQLSNALGINFNVGSAKAEATAQLLHDSGFTLARREIGWDSLSYQEPTKFLDESTIRTVLSALHNHGLRPLILLNANSGDPAPSKHLILETTSSAPAGAQTVTLAPSSAAEVVPGKTGFDGLTFGGEPDILITSVGEGGLATLSAPLPEALAAGTHPGTTLRYAPFTRPTLANGQPNPLFQETLAGWLSYVSTVCKLAASVVGPEGYDLEIWNELGFGSQFLNSEHYYSPGSEPAAAAAGNPEAETDSEPEYGAEAAAEAPEEMTKGQVTLAVIKALLRETVAYVRNPANGISPAVGITDGFASQSPFPSGAGTPAGLTALSKHPYAGLQSFPSGYAFKNIVPLNAFGERDMEKGSETPFFIPTYQSLFPEVTLTATHTETLIRDLAPFTTDIYGFPHGREVGPAGGTPPQEWVTEYNLGIGKAAVMDPEGTTPASGSSATLTATDEAHFHAKVALRSLVADVSKGIAREYFYAAKAGGLSLVGEQFFSALEANPSTYPGDSLGGETMTGLRNMLAQFQGPGPGGAPRPLQLLSIAQEGNHAQFTGDGTPAHPNLYDRDVLAVLPFQSSPTRFVIPVYVMTRDLLTLYEPNQPASDIHRFDLPDETFRITLGDLPATGGTPVISAYDPLRDESTPARLVSQTGGTATVEIAATDYPRILTVEYP
jgi:hypothetical protein